MRVGRGTLDLEPMSPEGSSIARSFEVTFCSSSYHSTVERGHPTIPKRSLSIARCIYFIQVGFL